MTPAEAVERIGTGADLNAFISLTGDDGDGPVVAVKDVIDVRGSVTTAGGAILPSRPAERDASAIGRLRERGCVVIGKTNLDEWALGVTSQNRLFGGVRNPRAAGRVPGGSSGGSAAAVAAGLCDWAIGTDTTGSIRVPASFCGVVGLKPTAGSVPLDGVVGVSPTLDTLGTLAPDVRTAARALELLSGRTDVLPERPRPLGELRLAVAAGWAADLEPEVAAAWSLATAGLPAIELPDRARMAGPALTIMLHEAATSHRPWLEAHPERYGPEARRLLTLGLEIDPARYSRALLELSRIRVETEAAMEGWDAVLTPTVRTPPPLLGEPYSAEDVTRYTRPFSTTGQPVVTLPAPVPPDVPPVGVSVVGRFGDERSAVESALALEEAWRRWER
jgi:aspartyl-tRNA(Asn)/glutamyl-tRNA(Gln) amidotransferase subunit A